MQEPFQELEGAAEQLAPPHPRSPTVGTEVAPQSARSPGALLPQGWKQKPAAPAADPRRRLLRSTCPPSGHGAWGARRAPSQEGCLQLLC